MTTGAALAGKYRLLRPLGKGSMGEVWAARHVELGHDVAVKLIYPGSPELAGRLEHEAAACGRLDHPNIVRVYDYGATDAGDPFMVMELLTGETLADRMSRRRRLPPPEAVAIAADIARALSAAHEAGIIHRDLKPANVYLARYVATTGEVVKVLDFGVSKNLTTDMGFTVTGALVGSPAYMSPEQARSLKEIDPRADLWSLGVLLFEMLSGARPFGGQTVVGVVAEILAGPIPPLSAMMPGVDPRLDDLVGRCLTRDVDQRVQSAVALAAALDAIAASWQGRRSGNDDLPTARLLREMLHRGAAPVPVAQDEEKTVAMRGALADEDKTTAFVQVHPSSAVAHDDDHDEAPTRVKPGDLSRYNAAGMTRKMDIPRSVRHMPQAPAYLFTPEGAPPPVPPRPPAWDPPPAWQAADAGRAADVSLPPEWEEMVHRRQGARVLLITAVAGLALGLVVVVGLSLLR